MLTQHESMTRAHRNDGTVTAEKGAMKVDHFVIATPDLDSGCAHIQNLFGHKPIYGGAHPGLGTRNALLGLADDIYIEILAPDPEQDSDLPLSGYLRTLKTTELSWWVVRVRDLDALEDVLTTAVVRIIANNSFTRTLPDGQTLAWRLLFANDPVLRSTLPFFIHWDQMALHPSRGLEAIGALKSFRIGHPDTARLRAILGNSFDLEESRMPFFSAEFTCGDKIIALSSPETVPEGIGVITIPTRG